MENAFTQFHTTWKRRVQTQRERTIFFHKNCTIGPDIRRNIGACGDFAEPYISDYLSGEGSTLRCSDHALRGWPSENSGEAAEALLGFRRPTIRVDHLDWEW